MNDRRDIRYRSKFPAAVRRAGPAVRRGAFAITAVVFFFVSAVWIHHRNAQEIDWVHPDEEHTVIYGAHRLNPFDGNVTLMRSGELNRWIVRFLYPFAVYYMNGKMGGEHTVTGWRYPGGYYLKEHLHWANVPSDPNLQDYVFFQRIMLGFLSLLSIVMLMGALRRRFGPAAAAGYAGLLLFGSTVFENFHFFYSHVTLIIVFNVALYMLLSRDARRLSICALSGAAASAALSTQISGVLVAGPLFAHVAALAWSRGGRREIAVAVFLASALASAVAINWPAASFFGLVNDTLANVYHYGTGHRVTEEGGWEYAFRIAGDVGYGAIPLFAVAAIYLLARPERGLVYAYGLIALIALAVFQMSNYAIYLSRNVAVVYVAMSFVVALAVGKFIEGRKGAQRRAGLAAALCFAVFAAGAGYRALSTPSPSRGFFEANAARLSECASLGVVGIPERDMRKFIDRDDAVFFERVRGPFNLSENPETFDKYLAYECLVVLRRGQSKQITNFFAPQSYRLADRAGDLFFFDKGP